MTISACCNNLFNKICCCVSEQTREKIKKVVKCALLILSGTLLCLVHTKVFFAALIIGYVLSSNEEGKTCYVSYLLDGIKDFYVQWACLGVVLTFINAIHAVYAAHILATLALGRELKRMSKEPSLFSCFCKPCQKK